MKFLKFLFVLILLAAAAIAGGAWYGKQEAVEFINQPVKIEQETLFNVASGMTLNRAINQMVAEQWVEASPVSRFIPRLHPELTQLKVGSYQLKPSDTLKVALQRMVDGKEHQLSLTFIEGSRFSEWREQLANAEGLKHTIGNMSEEEIAKALNIEHKKLEGLFLAETYNYTIGMSDLDLLNRAHQSLTKILDKAWENRSEDLPLNTPYEALTLASIIEKETGVASERRQVSSVFINRLNVGMLLQTDPTVIYGMGDRYDGNIRKKDLREATDYNTYVIKGLPPTPIAMSGKEAIEAALDPDSTDYFYFVASGHGGHVFSRNLAEHNRAVQEYLKVLRSNR